MSFLWLLLLPAYALLGGFIQEVVHRGHSEQKRERCEEGDDIPCFIWAGIFWPIGLAFLTLVAFARLGIKAEKLRHRKEIRDSKIEALEKENDLR